MISISYYPDKVKLTKTIIMARVHPGDIRVSTGLSINPKHWVGGELYVSTKEKRVNYIRLRLKEIDSLLFQECSRRQDKGETFTSEDLAVLINPARKKEQAAVETLRQHYDRWKKEYLKRKNRNNKEGNKGVAYANSLNQALTWIEQFSPAVQPNDINQEFVHNYLDFIYAESTLQDVTINNHLKFLRTILEYVGLNHSFIQNIEGDPNETFDLYWPEVLALKDTVYSSKEVEQAAHTFVINCQLPYRWEDLTSLQPEHYLQVQSSRYRQIRVINSTQSKTLAGVYLPIPPLATELINYHKGIPIAYRKGAPYYMDYYNNLRQAAKQAGINRLVQQSETRNQQRTYFLKPIHEVISPHNARHTAASRVFEVTKNEALKERLLGHKKKSDPYTKVPGIVIADDLLDAWQKIEGSLL